MRSDEALPLVELDGVSFTPAGALAPTLNDLCLRVDEGERLVVIGPSGSGKSSLGYLLTGIHGLALDGTTTGRLVFQGQTPHPGAPPAWTSMLLQRFRLQLRGATVREHLEASAARVSSGGKAPRATDVIERFALESWLDTAVERLSSGWAQRTVLTGLLLRRPRLLVLDEPFAHLDPEASRALKTLLLSLSEDEEVAVIVLDHRLAPYADWATRALRLEAGQAVFDGPPDKFPEDRLDCPPRAPFAAVGRQAAPVVLEIRDLEFAYSRAESVLSGVQLKLCRGEAVALLGPNGSGKSTLLALAKGILKPSAGSLSLRSGRALFEGVGYVPAVPDDQLFAETVRAECGFVLERRGMSAARRLALVHEALEALGIAELELRSPFSLSHGEKRRLGIASVLVAGPELLALDEPSSGLDSCSLAAVARALSVYLDRGGAVLLATHDAEFANLLGARRIELASCSKGITPIHPPRPIPRPRQLRPVTRVIACAAELVAAATWSSAFALLGLALAVLATLPNDARSRWSRLVTTLLLGASPATYLLMLLSQLEREAGADDPWRGALGPTILYLARTAAVLAASAALATRLTPESLLGLLCRLRFPKSASYVAALALRTLPDAREETVRIVSVQKARGLRLRTVRSLLTLIVPIFASHLRRAQESALAVELHPLRLTAASLGPFTMADAAVFVAALALVSAGWVTHL